jgi:hypothetical protein
MALRLEACAYVLIQGRIASSIISSWAPTTNLPSDRLVSVLTQRSNSLVQEEMISAILAGAILIIWLVLSILSRYWRQEKEAQG